MRPYHNIILTKAFHLSFYLNDQLVPQQDDGIGHYSPKHGDDTYQHELFQVCHILGQSNVCIERKLDC